MNNSGDLNQFFNCFVKEKSPHGIRLCMKKNALNRVLEIINYILIKRISIERNFLEIYSWFIIGFCFTINGFSDAIIKSCFEIYKIFIEKRKMNTTYKEALILKSIGNFLEKIFNFSHDCFLTKYFSSRNLFYRNYESSCVTYKIQLLFYLLNGKIGAKRKTNAFYDLNSLNKNLSEILNLIFISKELDILVSHIFKRTFYIALENKYPGFNAKFSIISKQINSIFPMTYCDFYKNLLLGLNPKEKHNNKFKFTIPKKESCILPVDIQKELYFEYLLNLIDTEKLIGDILFLLDDYRKRRKILNFNFENYFGINSFLKTFFFSFKLRDNQISNKFFQSTTFKIFLGKKNFNYLLTVKKLKLNNRLIRIMLILTSCITSKKKKTLNFSKRVSWFYKIFFLAF